MSRVKNYLHIVFGTKYRQRTIPMDRRERMYQYITKTIENKKCKLIKINGMQEHIHILINLHPTVALADLVKTVKTSATKKLIETYYWPMFEGWASEYYACSVSPSHVEGVKSYIENQEIHHHGKEYKEEVEDFVKKMGMVLYKDEV